MPRYLSRGSWRGDTLHASDGHILIWFTKGQGRILIEGTRIAFGANAVVFLPAGTPHAFDAKPGLFGQVVEIAQDAGVDMPSQPIFYRVKDLLQHGEFVGIFEAMQREVARENAPARDRACRLHAGILGVWLERQENHLARAGASRSAEQLTKRYLKLVEKHYVEAPSVRALAEELGVTATHLSRACQRAAGASAHQLLNERLMYEARARLSSSETPIQRIAQDLGFSSAAYFTRAFQKNTGQTPSAFRALN